MINHRPVSPARAVSAKTEAAPVDLANLGALTLEVVAFLAVTFLAAAVLATGLELVGATKMLAERISGITRYHITELGAEGLRLRQIASVLRPLRPKQVDLLPTKIRALQIVSRNNQIAVVEVGDRLGVTRNSANRIIRALKHDGLINREFSDPERLWSQDAKRITAKGQAELARYHSSPTSSPP